MAASTHASPVPRRTARSVRAWAAALALCGAGAAHEVAALEFECSAPGDVRHVRVDLPGEDHLCEVSVTGADEERRVMWYADHETLYCSAKAYELRDKYVDTWSFDCREWPDRDGVDRLSARHRAILDIQLKSLRARAEAGEERLDVTGVRAVASTPLERRDGVLALQFFFADGTDLVRIVLDEAGGWTTLVEVEGLAARIATVEGLVVTDAFVDAIGENGVLEVVTLLAPDDTPSDEPAPDGAAANGTARRTGAAPDLPACEGRQTLRQDERQGLAPLGAHRHVCDERAPTDAG